MTPEIDFTLAREHFQKEFAKRVLAILVQGVQEGRVKVLDRFQIDPETGLQYLEDCDAYEQLIEELTPIARGIYGPEHQLQFTLQRETWN